MIKKCSGLCGITVHNEMKGKNKGERCSKCGNPTRSPRMMPRGFCTGAGTKQVTHADTKKSFVYWRDGKETRKIDMSSGKPATAEVITHDSVAKAKKYMAEA